MAAPISFKNSQSRENRWQDFTVPDLLNIVKQFELKLKQSQDLFIHLDLSWRILEISGNNEHSCTQQAEIIPC